MYTHFITQLISIRPSTNLDPKNCPDPQANTFAINHDGFLASFHKNYPEDPRKSLIKMEGLVFRHKENRGLNRSSEESYAGPGLPDPSLSTPPVTPSPPRPLAKRLRRTRGLSEDEPPQDEDGIKNEDYRTGGPYLSSLPAITEGVPQDSPLTVAWINGGIRKDTIEILNTHAVKWNEVSIFKREHFRAPEIDPGASTETIFIMAAKRIGEDWRGVCRDIRNVCILYNLHGTSVEIADERGLKAVESFGVGPNEPIYKAWPILKKKSLTSWEYVLGLPWSFCDVGKTLRQKKTR